MAFPGEQISLRITKDSSARFGAAGAYLAIEGVFLNDAPYARTGFVRFRESTATSRALLAKSGDVIKIGRAGELVADLEGDELAQDETLEVRARIFDDPDDAPLLSDRTLDQSQASTRVIQKTVQKDFVVNGTAQRFVVGPKTAGVPSRTIVVQAVDIEAGAGPWNLGVSLSPEETLPPLDAPNPTIALIGDIAAGRYTSAELNKECAGLFPIALSFDSALVFTINPEADATFTLSFSGYVT